MVVLVLLQGSCAYVFSVCTRVRDHVIGPLLQLLLLLYVCLLLPWQWVCMGPPSLPLPHPPSPPPPPLPAPHLLLPSSRQPVRHLVRHALRIRTQRLRVGKHLGGGQGVAVGRCRQAAAAAGYSSCSIRYDGEYYSRCEQPVQVGAAAWQHGTRACSGKAPLHKWGWVCYAGCTLAASCRPTTSGSMHCAYCCGCCYWIGCRLGAGAAVPPAASLSPAGP
jgi:hypothetical protein